MERVKKVMATFERDTKRYHRFRVDEGDGITGSLYISKTGEVPEVLEIRLQSKGDHPSGQEGGK